MLLTRSLVPLVIDFGHSVMDLSGLALFAPKRLSALPPAIEKMVPDIWPQIESHFLAPARLCYSAGAAWRKLSMLRLRSVNPSPPSACISRVARAASSCGP